MKEFSENLCKEKHSTIDNKFKDHKERLDNHGKRIDSLEQHRSKVENQIENLISQIKSLVSTLQWILRIVLGSGLGFFIWYLQTL